MAGDPFGARVTSERAIAELSLIQKRVDIGTAAGVRKVQAVTKRSIKAQMRGRPRWDQRGKSKRTGPEVKLGLTPHHVSKGGGPGKLSGALSNSIRSSKKPRPVAGGEGFSGVVFSGGASGPQNLYKKKVEATAPYFKPGLEKAKPKMPIVWHEAWAKAMNPRR